MFMSMRPEVARDPSARKTHFEKFTSREAGDDSQRETQVARKRNMYLCDACVRSRIALACDFIIVFHGGKCILR